MAKVPIRSLFFLIQKRYLQTPAKAAAAPAILSPTGPPLSQCKDSNFTVEFLVKSCGLPLESAISTSKRFQLNERKQEKYQSLVDLFRSQSFSQAQIAKTIEKDPRLLQYRAEETLKPKFDFLKENGFVGEFLVELIVKNSGIVKMSLASTMKPRLEILKSYLASNEKIVAAVKKAPRLLTCNLKRKVDFLIKEGLPSVTIAKLLAAQPCIIIQSNNRVAYVVNAVKKLGLSPSSPVFIPALYLMTSLSESTLKKKMEVLRSLGWTTQDIMSTLKKYPHCLTLSEENIRRTMDFYVNSVNLDPQIIVRTPSMLVYAIDSRLRPRNNVLKILMSRKLIQKDIKAKWFRITDKEFLERYAIKYADKVPGLLDVYGGHKIIQEISESMKFAPGK